MLRKYELSTSIYLSRIWDSQIPWSHMPVLSIAVARRCAPPASFSEYHKKTRGGGSKGSHMRRDFKASSARMRA
jgi:hypothetical protein